MCTHCLVSEISGIHGVAIDEATWRGEDVFVPRGIPGLVVVSQRFHDVCASRGLTNINLVPARDYVETFGLSQQ